MPHLICLAFFVSVCVCGSHLSTGPGVLWSKVLGTLTNTIFIEFTEKLNLRPIHAIALLSTCLTVGS